METLLRVITLYALTLWLNARLVRRLDPHGAGLGWLVPLTGAPIAGLAAAVAFAAYRSLAQVL